MTSLFDGVSSMLAATFGGRVMHAPAQGVPVEIEAIFRREQVEMLAEDGTVSLDMAPMLHVAEPVASTIATGDLVTPEGGVAHRVKNRHPSGSPAVDAFVIFQLQEV